MKAFFHLRAGTQKRGGFSLVEATFSIGLMSCGFLTLAPLLALGMKSARLAQDDRATAQIAQTLAEEAKQGATVPAVCYFDSGGASCGAAQAAFTAQSASAPVAGSPALTQWTLHLTPVGAPDRARTYAVVFPAPTP